MTDTSARDTSPTEAVADQVTDLVEGFVEDHAELTDPWRLGELEYSEDCDVLSDAFTAYCRGRGLDAFTVQVKMTSPFEAMLDIHYFTVVTLSPTTGGETGRSTAVDFTARQFYNCDAMPLDMLDIDFPLVFSWPGDYPLPTLTATTAAQTS